MFTGIIRTVRKVRWVQRKHGSLFFEIEKPKWKVQPGDSVATNGVCLTVREVLKRSYRVELMPETLRVTTFAKSVPARVNLEPSLRYGDQLDGHFVTGHVDAIGTITGIRRAGRARIYTIRFPKKFSKLVAAKGSIAVDGISLTVVAVAGTQFIVSLVDYTLKHTTIADKKAGDILNLEFDLIAKYAKR